MGKMTVVTSPMSNRVWVSKFSALIGLLYMMSVYAVCKLTVTACKAEGVRILLLILDRKLNSIPPESCG